MNPVWIVAAAVISEDKKLYSLPRPARHADVLLDMIAKQVAPIGKKGFLLSDGSFADRRQALVVAKRSGQYCGDDVSPELISEDVW